MDALTGAIFLLASALPATGQIAEGPVCVANGQTYRQGETACIELPCQTPYLARCTMVLNNSSWRKESDQCPLSAVPGGTATASLRGGMVEPGGAGLSCRR